MSSTESAKKSAEQDYLLISQPGMEGLLFPDLHYGAEGQPNSKTLVRLKLGDRVPTELINPEVFKASLEGGFLFRAIRSGQIKIVAKGVTYTQWQKDNVANSPFKHMLTQPEKKDDALKSFMNPPSKQADVIMKGQGMTLCGEKGTGTPGALSQESKGFSEGAVALTKDMLKPAIVPETPKKPIVDPQDPLAPFFAKPLLEQLKDVKQSEDAAWLNSVLTKADSKQLQANAKRRLKALKQP